MEDMPARNTRLGSTRPPSSSLVVQVRCHGLLFAFALTGFALVLLSQLDTAEANAYVRSPLQNGGEEETEVYFTEWPPHTYCHLRNTTGFYTFDDADKYCQSIAMSVLSMIYTPMYRICRLIRLFGIKDHRLWVEDM
ncbi:hypothetical protein HPB52_001784 [Rhipicephalus sanguineus]|uniref:Uncharacterized protein n=1 Tax=Rhipicephalus sanguineus TaxID=34632 RepID=A0A9D4QBM7_RHISA|nr:hypothetical protein HPB52_001784 [Rhipicephalus sanguineus]